ncbi:unnamed protein product [Rodentolepis nana]|uniref:Endo/exonuclease/phosphatase domain-containing protein n=1 Tax=Rodentolepis nana TaxID=102285 RepID=A0A0R3TIG6_RODNA|nr:unnamed protein product [Rodentolepis nana]
MEEMGSKLNSHSGYYWFSFADATSLSSAFTKEEINKQFPRSDKDPATCLHNTGTRTTPDLLLVSSDICELASDINDPGSGHKPVIASGFLLASSDISEHTRDLLLASSDISEHTRRISSWLQATSASIHAALDDPGSGHKPVITRITMSNKCMTPKMPTKLSWNFKKADWSRFTNLLENEFHASLINYNHHPDKLCNNITNVIIRCAKKFIPRYIQRSAE